MSEPTDDIGSVPDEAVKLFGALSDWARDHGSDLGHGLSGLVDHAAASAREVNEHLADNMATGSAECAYCPICRTVHAVRQTSPEVRAHLAVAASALLQAAAGMLATSVSPNARTGGRGPGVERIDLDADGARDGAWPEEDDE